MSHYYSYDDLNKIPELVKLAPQASSSFFVFEKEVYAADGAIPLKIKELIAVAVAHVTGCPYCIDTHVRRYKELDGTPEEILEAVLVAASTRAGAVLSHATQALSSLERAPSAPRKEQDASAGPDCFC